MNNKRKWCSAVMVIGFCISSLSAAGQKEAGNTGAVSERSASFVTITDFLGREVTVERPVKKIAFTHYSSAEAVQILDAWDRVVARDGYTSDKLIYPNIDEIPALTAMMGNCYEPNMELLLDLKPDLLVLEVIPMPGIEELIRQLDGIIPVITVQTYDPDEMVHSFEILGTLLGKEQEASAYIKWNKRVEESISEKTAGLMDTEKTRIFFKTGYGTVEDLMTFSNDMSYISARNRITACINIAADLPSQGGWVPSLDREWLVAQDYDVLIIGDPQPKGYGPLITETSPLAEYRKKVMELPVFTHSSAVKNNRVYMQADVFFGTPRFIIGFVYMAKWFHPDLFEELDPAEIHQEYFTQFLRSDADVVNTGAFVYPENG